MADVKAVTRIEAILNGEDITPVTREEAILSGADVEPLSREEYFVQKRLAGGGGGLDYVIPEQTVTLESGSAQLNDVDVSEMEVLDYAFFKVAIAMGGNTLTAYAAGYLDTEEGLSFNFNHADIPVIVKQGNSQDDKWYLESGDLPDGTSVTISAIKAPF